MFLFFFFLSELYIAGANIVLNRVSSLVSILEGVAAFLATHNLTDWQGTQLSFLLNASHNTLTDIGKIVNQRSDLQSSNAYVRSEKGQRTWRRQVVDPTEMQELRSRIVLNVTNLSAFTQSLTR